MLSKKDQYQKDWLRLKKIMREIQLMRYGGDCMAYNVYLKRAHDELKRACLDLKNLIEN